jgi:hypothetical protein
VEVRVPRSKTSVAAAEAVPNLSRLERRLLQAYVDIIASLDATQTVLAEKGSEGFAIWTVIDAEPFDWAPRESVYAAELQACDTTPETLVEFRLLNQREYDHETLSQIVPAPSQIVWQRPQRP